MMENNDYSIVRTGYIGLDNIGFLKRNEVSLIAGRPAMGKTCLALNIAANVAKNNQKVCIASFELNKNSCIERLVKIKDMDESYIANITILDDLHKISSPEEIAKSVKNECPDVALVIVDYIQLMEKGTDRFRDDLLGTFMALFKIRPAILLLSQASRACETRRDKHLHIEDVPSAMEFLPYINNLAMLYRPAYYDFNQSENDDMEVNILKGENAPVRVMLRFIRDAYMVIDKHEEDKAFIHGISIGLDCGESDDEFTPDVLLISPPGEIDSNDEPYEYEIMTRNGTKCFDRLIELFNNYEAKGYVSTALSKASVTNFFSWDNDDISFQEYDGTLNEEAIRTFFKHGYCFISDMPFDDKYMIWACGDNLKPLVNECIEKATKDAVAETIMQYSSSDQVKLKDNKVRISVWRIREGF